MKRANWSSYIGSGSRISETARTVVASETPMPWDLSTESAAVVGKSLVITVEGGFNILD